LWLNHCKTVEMTRWTFSAIHPAGRGRWRPLPVAAAQRAALIRASAARAVLLTASILVAAAPASAQSGAQLASPAATHAKSGNSRGILPPAILTEESVAATSPVSLAVAGGVLGSATGLIAGAVAGYQLSDCSGAAPDDWCGVEVALLGALAGATLGSAAAAYLGARSGRDQPSLAHTRAGAVAGAGAGLLLGIALDSGAGATGATFLLAFTLGQGTVAGVAAAVWK
jgi:hypothetical protein